MLPDRLPPRRIPCRRHRRLPLGNLGAILLTAVLATSCSHRSNRAPQPANGAAAVDSTSTSIAPPVPAHGLVLHSPPGPAAPPSMPPRFSPAVRVGTVRTVGAGSRFVLLETTNPGSASGITDGQELRCNHPNTADDLGPAIILKVSRERKPPFIVADVLSGQPEAGDAVYTVKGSAAAAVPASTPPVTSFLLPPAARPAAPAAATSALR